MYARFASVIRLALALVVALGAVSVAPIGETQAQCQPRTDWGTYVVVRGDTLSRIARRFGATVASLTSGNCLANANRIYVGQRLRVPRNGGGDPVPVPGPGTRDQIVPVTYQAYQNGFLVWRADTGDVWAYVGVYQSGGTGELLTYASAQYARLPAQSVTPPPGFIAPIMGFNRVWSNLGDLRRRLGWAVNTELSYTPWVRTVGGALTSFTLPSGLVALKSSAGWMVTGTGPRDPFPPVPVEPVSRIVNFATQPGPVMQVGDTLTVTWKVEGTQFALLTVWDGDTNVAIRSWESLPTEGTVTMTVPTMLTNEMRLVLLAADLGATTPTRQWITRSSASISLNVLERATTVTTQAAFQPYAQGFMIWRQDTGMIYVFGLGMGTYPESSYQSFPDNVCTELAPGMICPINGFGRVWANDFYIRRALGWPTAQEQSYQITIVSRNNIPLSMTLPDGRKVLIDDGWNYHF